MEHGVAGRSCTQQNLGETYPCSKIARNVHIWICPKIADIPKSNGCHAYCTWGYLRMYIYIGIYSNMACNMGEYRINSKPVAMLKIQLSASHIKTLGPLFPLVPPLTTCGRYWGCGTPCLTLLRFVQSVMSNH